MEEILIISGFFTVVIYIVHKIYIKYVKPNFIKGFYYKELKEVEETNFKPRPNFYFSQNQTNQAKGECHSSYSKATLEAKALYYALKNKGILVELEKFDGFKTIDLAIPSAKINIEVDGIHHNANSDQALADLKRTYYSYLKGYYTIRIPNSLLRTNLEETADYLAEMCNKSYETQSKYR